MKHTRNARGAPADKIAAVDLELYIDNTSNLSPVGPTGQGREIVKNLMRKRRSGKYDVKKSVKLWGYLAESGAKAYTKENGGDWKTMFVPATRKLVAESLAENFDTMAEDGEFDHVDLSRG